MSNPKALGASILVLLALGACALASAAAATNFTASSYPTTVTATSALGNDNLKTEAGSVECASHFEGIIKEASTTQTITPTYTSCKAFGFVSATVNMNGCDYAFHTNGEASVICPGGKTVVIAAAGCEVTIGGQTGLNSVALSNNGSHIDAKAGLTGIHYVVTKDGFLCPFAGTGTKTGATYSQSSAITMKPVSGGANIDIGSGATATSLTTSLSGEGKSGEAITVNEGAKVKDQATLSGTNASKATGTVEYRVYSDSGCKELVTTAGKVTVTAGSVPVSSEVELTAGAVYYWQAVYSGDANNLASTSVCGKEVLTVKAATSLTTSLSGGGKSGTKIEVDEEVGVTDKATLSGTNASKATGTVKYSVYSDPECKELVKSAGEVSVTGGSVPSSSEVKLADGVYYWVASYGGDTTHLASTAACGSEIQIVAAATTLTTSLTSASETGEEIEVEEDEVVFDTATLSGANTSEATGFVQYSIYADEECSELVGEAGTVELGEEGAIPESSPAVLPAGTYYWQAEYNGDLHNQGSRSTCGDEVLVVKAPPLTTLLSGEGQSGTEIEVEEEAPVTDTATLNMANAGTATGTVKYKVYSDPECKELVKSAGEVSVAGGVVPKSNEVELPAGVYYWQAEYSGDMSHPAATSICGDEIEIVAAGTSLSTSLSGGGKSGPEIEVRAGTAVSDKATLSGANTSEATGFVQYSIYEDSKCEKLFKNAGTVEVTEGVVPKSEEVPLSAGTYYWQARYFGDESNQESVSPCGVEIAHVGPALITNDLAGGEQEGAKIEVPEETPVKDTATLNIENAATATGTVKYSIYADPECKELVKSAGEGSVSAGVVSPSNEMELAEGTYYWQAKYLGDETHEAATSPCGEAQQMVGLPWILSVGDSFISGEGGAWAGNVLGILTKYGRIDAWPDAHNLRAYRTPLNGEENGEGIPYCHRSRSAAIFIGPPGPRGFNIACSGAMTASYSINGLLPDKFKPGLDFIERKQWEFLYPNSRERGWCPLQVCQGQAKMLENAAKWIKNRKERIEMVVISIGGNDFGFGAVVANCVGLYVIKDCAPGQQFRFEPKWTVPIQANIKWGIENVGQALVNAGFNKNEFTLLVQNYPSLIPNAGGFRFQGGKRILPGRCQFRNNDANWANETALATINETVKKAAEEAGANYTVKRLKIEGAFNGRRLCENNVELLAHPRFSNTPHWTVPGAADRTEWINQVRLATAPTPFFIDEDIHPNFWAQLGLRSCVRKAYNNGAPKEGTCSIEGPGLVKPGPEKLAEPKMKLGP